MLSGYLPFGGRTPSEIEGNVLKGNFKMENGWSSISREAKSFIRKLMEYNPKKRYSSD
jgi:calcium-dependent protein kinase